MNPRYKNLTGEIRIDFPTLQQPNIQNETTSASQLLWDHHQKQVQLNNITSKIEKDAIHWEKFQLLHGLHVSNGRYDIDEFLNAQTEGANEPPTVISAFGQWFVCENGLIASNGYFIPRTNTLFVRDWLSHMSRKPWVIMGDLLEAYYHAKSIYHFLDVLQHSQEPQFVE